MVAGFLFSTQHCTACAERSRSIALFNALFFVEL